MSERTDDAITEIYLEELRRNLEKVERCSRTFEHWEACMEEMRVKYSFLLDPNFEMASVEPEEMELMEKMIEYDRLQP